MGSSQPSLDGRRGSDYRRRYDKRAMFTKSISAFARRQVPNEGP